MSVRRLSVIAEGVPAVPKAERSSFAQALSQGRFVTIGSSRLRRASSVT